MRYRPGKERREIPDGDAKGLYLVVQPSGHRSFALRFRRPNGKPCKLVLGSFDASGKEPEGGPVLGTPLTLAAARALAAEVHRLRKSGRDVVADHLAAKHRQRAEVEEGAANAFGACARQFIDEYAKPETRRWRATARHFGLDYPKDGGEPTVIKGGLAQRWADRPVREIDGHDVFGVIDETRRLGVPGLERRSEKPTEGQARAMLASLSTIFTWLGKRRIVERNPCVGVHRPAPSRPRDRVLDAAEMAKFWEAASAERTEVAVVLKLLLLTGARLNEAAGMQRSELSDDGTTWNLPGSRTKNRRPLTVPLPPMARDLIASVKSIAGAAGFVFTTNGRVPIAGWSIVKARLDAAMKIAPWRLHDLRRTAATGMAEIGIAPHIVEAALNHVSGAKAGVAGTYNRAAYAPEKRAALERWAERIERLVINEPEKKVFGLRTVQK
jgi:integrase